MNFPKIPMNNQHHQNDAAEREFDAVLHEIDDYLGEAPGLSISPDFAPRVIERAQAMRLAVKTVKQSWSIRHWFSGFSLATRVAVSAAILLATFCGFRTGQVMTEAIAQRNAPPQAEVIDQMGMAAPELAIVQLMRGDGLATDGHQRRTGGEER